MMCTFLEEKSCPDSVMRITRKQPLSLTQLQ